MLTHSIVLSLATNRELNLKRRDLLRADLNKQYAALCNPSTTVSQYLFGDDLNKEMDDPSKASKLTRKVTPNQRVEPYRRPMGRSAGMSSRSSNYRGRGSSRPGAFLGFGRGQPRNYQRSSQRVPKVNSQVGNYTHLSIVSLIQNQGPFQGGRLSQFQGVHVEASHL